TLDPPLPVLRRPHLDGPGQEDTCCVYVEGKRCGRLEDASQRSPPQRKRGRSSGSHEVNVRAWRPGGRGRALRQSSRTPPQRPPPRLPPPFPAGAAPPPTRCFPAPPPPARCEAFRRPAGRRVFSAAPRRGAGLPATARFPERRARPAQPAAQARSILASPS